MLTSNSSPKTLAAPPTLSGEPVSNATRRHKGRFSGFKAGKSKMNKKLKKDRVKGSEHRAKDEDAPITSLLAGQALPEDQMKAQHDVETCFLCRENGQLSTDCYQSYKVAGSEEMDDHDTSDSESGKE
ncbi:hypothetical protein E4U39_005095 [Claviceps sp. Clav50 group G5]|nr:hypothetical protein E4U39_005095 [Claviceps sp. Clav50 group G5]